MSYYATAARMIADLLIEHGVRTVPRADLIARWHVRYQRLNKPQIRSDAAHERLRRRSYLGQKTSHHGRSMGNRGTVRLNETLRQLEAAGVLVRTADTIRVIDVPKLVRIRDSEGPT